MTDPETAITPQKGSTPEDRFTYQDLLEQIKAPLEHEHEEGPWNGSYLPPMTHRSATFSFVPLMLQIRTIDQIAYLSSVDHIHRALEHGFPDPEAAVADPDFTQLDMWGEWVGFARGDKFSFAGLTHERDREIGCAYLYPPVDGDDPYESGLHIWTIEEALGRDLDLALLREFMGWVEAEWAFNSVVCYVPEAYQRGLDIAVRVGFQRVERKTAQPNYAALRWSRS